MRRRRRHKKWLKLPIFWKFVFKNAIKVNNKVYKHHCENLGFSHTWQFGSPRFFTRVGGYSQNCYGTKNRTRFSQWCLYTLLFTFNCIFKNKFSKIGNFNLVFEAPSVPHIQRYLPIVMVQNQRCCTKKYPAGGEKFSRSSLANAMFTK